MSYDPERELERYLKRLAREARHLPRARRRELLSEIEQHLRQALAETPVTSEAELLTLLDQVGDPAEIAAAADGDSEGTVRSTRMETAAIVLLLIGGFLWGVGWLAGVVLLWSSGLWTLRDKLVGTLIVPGGLATAFFVVFVAFAVGGSSSVCVHHLDGTTTGSCTGGTSTLEVIGVAIGLVVLALAPVATSVYLGRRLNSQKRRLLGGPSAAMG